MADQQKLLDAWYQGRWWLYLLYPLSLLFRALAAVRRRRQQPSGETLTAPVVVVGNIAVGGTGKTPIIIALCRYLQQQGLKPGVISRGYGGNADHYPMAVTPISDPAVSGDEPLLIALETECPVVVSPNRTDAARFLLANNECDIILSDDGMQHYRLDRQWEICVIDGNRGLGNGLCLPAGPLREPPSRLIQVDAIISNGSIDDHSPHAALLKNAFCMSLQPCGWYKVDGSESCAVVPLPWNHVEKFSAVTGIGNPQRFFRTLNDLGLSNLETRSFADHHAFTPEDLAFARGRPLLMTAKDAVKCRSFAEPDWWFLSVEAKLPDQFFQQFEQFLQQQGLL